MNGNQNITEKFIDNTIPSHTKTEIEGQTGLWKLIFKLLVDEKDEIQNFLAPLFKKSNLQIILTGAGSSAFIGEAAQGIVQKHMGCSTRAIATTDLVTHPELFFLEETPTLLISFARSGNSPESVESVKLANQYCDEVFHFFITCNEEGELMKYSAENKDSSYALLLPEACNDKSLAMTGSFTCMLLSVLLISDLGKLKKRTSEVEEITRQGEIILDHSTGLKEVAGLEFERVVFLGSGPMLGIARECHLKLQELTDGQVICKFDSFLGFRHGPRAVTSEKTLLVYLFSPDDHVYQYELDLAHAIAKDSRDIQCLSIGRPEEKILRSCLNIDLELTSDQELNIVPATMVGQILGYYKSLGKNLNPDNPSVSGSISRVVQGVTIYEQPENSQR